MRPSINYASKLTDCTAAYTFFTMCMPLCLISLPCLRKSRENVEKNLFVGTQWEVDNAFCSAVLTVLSKERFRRSFNFINGLLGFFHAKRKRGKQTKNVGRGCPRKHVFVVNKMIAEVLNGLVELHTYH